MKDHAAKLFITTLFFSLATVAALGLHELLGLGPDGRHVLYTTFFLYVVVSGVGVSFGLQQRHAGRPWKLGLIGNAALLIPVGYFAWVWLQHLTSAA